MTEQPNIKKALENSILHRYALYSFEMEVHPDDDPEKLMSEVNSRNLDLD